MVWVWFVGMGVGITGMGYGWMLGYGYLRDMTDDGMWIFTEIWSRPMEWTGWTDKRDEYLERTTVGMEQHHHHHDRHPRHRHSFSSVLPISLFIVPLPTRDQLLSTTTAAMATMTKRRRD